MAEKNSGILLQTGLSYDRPEELAVAVERIFALCPSARRLGPESSVLLKPNLLAKHPPEHAARLLLRPGRVPVPKLV